VELKKIACAAIPFVFICVALPAVDLNSGISVCVVNTPENMASKKVIAKVCFMLVVALAVLSAK
jgi:hypothetical protein